MTKTLKLNMWDEGPHPEATFYPGSLVVDPECIWVIAIVVLKRCQCQFRIRYCCTRYHFVLVIRIRICTSHIYDPRLILARGIGGVSY